MKKTELKDVYCVPKTEAEANKFGCDLGMYVHQNEWGLIMYLIEEEMDEIEDKTEVPVSKFSDLLEDRIVSWRLEEIGFDIRGVDGCSRVLQITKRTVLSFDTVVNEVWLGDLQLNISTFTELETLIGFLK